MAAPERVGHAAGVVAPVPAARADPRAAGRPRTHRDRQGVRAAESRLAALAARRRTRQPVLPVVGDSREQRASRQLRCRPGNDSRARGAAPRRPCGAGWRPAGRLPADPAGDGLGRGHRRTAAEQAAGVVRDRPEPGAGAARTPGKWQDDGAVYAEVRGRLLGRGVDGEADSDDGAKLAALRPDAYRRQRGNEQGIGAATAKTLPRLWERVPESTRVEIFPIWRRPRPPRACSPARACRRGWSSTVSSSTRRRT